MRTTTFALILLLGTSIACEKEKVPEGVLTHEEMADLMIHVYLAESRTLNVNVNKDSLYRLFRHYQDELMKKKGISDSTLAKSYAYYLEHPTELEEIYDALIDSLSLLEQRTRPVPQ